MVKLRSQIYFHGVVLNLIGHGENLSFYRFIDIYLRGTETLKQHEGGTD
jgi:hypothetical protein